MAFADRKSGRKLIELTNLLSHHARIYKQTNGNSKQRFMAEAFPMMVQHYKTVKLNKIVQGVQTVFTDFAQATDVLQMDNLTLVK